MRFQDLTFKEKNFSTQALVFFSNGYGASVIKEPYTYGGLEGRYELAVLLGTKEAYSLTYKTPITDDVLGYLSEEEVTEALLKIEDLEKAS